MIDKKWMDEFAEKVEKCPWCKQKSLCLIFHGDNDVKVWECADTKCTYHKEENFKEAKFFKAKFPKLRRSK